MDPLQELGELEEASGGMQDCEQIQGITARRFRERDDARLLAGHALHSAEAISVRVGLHILAFPRGWSPGPIDERDQHLREARHLLHGLADDRTAWHVAFSFSAAFGPALCKLYEGLSNSESRDVRLQLALNMTLRQVECAPHESAALLQRLLIDDDPTVRYMAVVSLGSLTSGEFPWHVRALRRALNDEHPPVREEALRLLTDRSANG